jgi:ArsR family transcriptional regulator, cadmium/lead-responsive transcriptional repressor
MAMISAALEMERTELAPAAALFRSLGDPARLMIVRRLAGGPARVTDLVSALGLAQSTVSRSKNSVSSCELGFCCGIGSVAGTISGWYCRCSTGW